MSVIKQSDCCGASFSPCLYRKDVRCDECKKVCMAVYPPCPLNVCDGSGEVAHYESNEFGSYTAGAEDCLCQKREQDHDPELD